MSILYLIIMYNIHFSLDKEQEFGWNLDIFNNNCTTPEKPFILSKWKNLN